MSARDVEAAIGHLDEAIDARVEGGECRVVLVVAVDPVHVNSDAGRVVTDVLQESEAVRVVRPEPEVAELQERFAVVPRREIA